MALNPRQKLFVEEYLKDRNATKAAIRAGYKASRARQTAYELLAEPEIQAIIGEKVEKISENNGLTVDFVIKNLMEAALMRSVKETKIIESEKFGATTEITETGLKPSEIVKPLEKLGEYLGMFKDKHQTEAIIPIINVMRDGS